MSKKSRLIVDGVEDFMNQYAEETAQEFGIFHTTTQTEHQAKIGSATRKIIDQKRKEKK